jgi:hypothetical protein
MNTVKEIRYNPRCVASITVKVRGRDTVKLGDKAQEIPVSKNKTHPNSC